MKKKIVIYFFIISFSFTFSVNGQITISPEVGFSYLPFTFYTLNDVVAAEVIRSRKPNLLLGISAQMPIHEKWNIKFRISYINRNDIEWNQIRFIDLGTRADIDYKWKHQDLNIDLGLYRHKLYKNLSIGIGSSLIRTFTEFSQRNNEENIFPLQKRSKYFLGLNGGVSIELKRVNINLMYIRTRKFNGKKGFRVPNGDNRLDFTVGYRIGKGK